MSKQSKRNKHQKKDSAEALLIKAQRLLDAGKFLKAIRCFDDALTKECAFSEGQIGKGDAFFGIGDYQNAEKAYRLGLSVTPKSPDGLFGLAATLRVCEAYDKAIPIYEQALEIEPDRTEAYWEMAYTKEMTGDLRGAKKDYKTCLTHHPGHGMAEHLLASLLGKKTLRAPIEYVRDLFDDYADTFEADLVNDLGYRVPQLILEALADASKSLKNINSPFFNAALDLGCGTGLVATAIKHLTYRIDGVDISENMLTVARKNKRYTRVYPREILDFLGDFSAGSQLYDLILSGDSLVYVGDLRPVFIAVKKRIAPHGLFCFTLENSSCKDFNLCRTGRYAHNVKYVHDLLDRTGFCKLASNKIVPRTDASVNIDGSLYLACPNPSAGQKI